MPENGGTSLFSRKMRQGVSSVFERGRCPNYPKRGRTATGFMHIRDGASLFTVGNGMNFLCSMPTLKRLMFPLFNVNKL